MTLFLVLYRAKDDPKYDMVPQSDPLVWEFETSQNVQNHWNEALSEKNSKWTMETMRLCNHKTVQGQNKSRNTIYECSTNLEQSTTSVPSFRSPVLRTYHFSVLLQPRLWFRTLPLHPSLNCPTSLLPFDWGLSFKVSATLRCMKSSKWSGGKPAEKRGKR